MEQYQPSRQGLTLRRANGLHRGAATLGQNVPERQGPAAGERAGAEDPRVRAGSREEDRMTSGARSGMWIWAGADALTLVLLGALLLKVVGP